MDWPLRRSAQAKRTISESAAKVNQAPLPRDAAEGLPGYRAWTR
jgi:hypothetical protein